MQIDNDFDVSLDCIVHENVAPHQSALFAYKPSIMANENLGEH